MTIALSSISVLAGFGIGFYWGFLYARYKQNKAAAIRSMK